jgi:heme exporter protein A
VSAGAGVALEFRSTGRRFGAVVALADATLTVGAGEALLILGPNGAGKSTLLRLAAGLTRPTSGQVLVDGIDLRGTKAGRARAAIGFLGHRSFLYEHLTAKENLELYARLYGVAGDTGALAERWLEKIGLARAAQRTVRGFSRGMMQRLALARALQHEPRLVLLDEPTTGLDPEGRARLDALLDEQRARGVTLAMISHRAEAALPRADRVLVLSRGRVAALGPAAERDAAGWTALVAAAGTAPGAAA